MSVILFSARGRGLEPRLTGPEPVVLPLDDPRIILFFPNFPISYLPCFYFKQNMANRLNNFS